MVVLERGLMGIKYCTISRARAAFSVVISAVEIVEKKGTPHSPDFEGPAVICASLELLVSFQT